MRMHGFTAIVSAALLLACDAGTSKPASNRTQPASPPEARNDHAERPHGFEPTGAPTPEEILAAETVAYERARPVFERHCARCHTSSGDHRQRRKALPHFDMDSYPFGGHHVTEMAQTMREVLGQAEDDASMPKDNPGVVQGEELARILEWADAFERSDAAGLHDRGKGHDDHGGHKH